MVDLSPGIYATTPESCCGSECEPESVYDVLLLRPDGTWAYLDQRTLSWQSAHKDYDPTKNAMLARIGSSYRRPGPVSDVVEVVKREEER